MAYQFNPFTGTLDLVGATVTPTVFYTEIPSGVIDGSNMTYTVLHDINTVLNFGINGQLIQPADYTFVGNTITFYMPLDASLSGTAFNIVYV